MNASAQPLIRLNGIEKVFDTDEVDTHALAGIHLEIQQGAYVAIAGPSACGKSTLLAILGLLATASEGAYTLNGQPSILLADEPTGNLDSKNGEAVMDLLRDLHRGGATICIAR